MRFDWYQATIPENPIVLVESLLERLAPGGEVIDGRGVITITRVLLSRLRAANGRLLC